MAIDMFWNKFALALLFPLAMMVLVPISINSRLKGAHEPNVSANLQILRLPHGSTSCLEVATSVRCHVYHNLTAKFEFPLILFPAVQMWDLSTALDFYAKASKGSSDGAIVPCPINQVKHG